MTLCRALPPDRVQDEWLDMTLPTLASSGPGTEHAWRVRSAAAIRGGLTSGPDACSMAACVSPASDLCVDWTATSAPLRDAVLRAGCRGPYRSVSLLHLSLHFRCRLRHMRPHATSLLTPDAECTGHGWASHGVRVSSMARAIRRVQVGVAMGDRRVKVGADPFCCPTQDQWCSLIDKRHEHADLRART